MSQIKVIISGGGTGGHIFPAISIANAVRESEPGAKILFVGALGKMEMEKVPAAGYEIIGLPVAGFHRKLTLRNLSFPFKLLKSLARARKVVRNFKPDVAVGVGGYASGPVLRIAARAGVPCLLQEQNSFPGVTNRILSKMAEKVCVAYEKMDRFFEAEKLLLTGNPVRGNLITELSREEAAAYWKLDPNKKTILVIGGSLGARSVNRGVLSGLNDLPEDCQLIWQTGKLYFDEMSAALPDAVSDRVILTDFIAKMDMAFAVADVVVSRAGAGTISELALLGKPSIFVPSPNVAEDHQTKNAMALVEKDAALLVRDAEAATLIREASELAADEARCLRLAKQIKQLAKPEAAREIAREVISMAKRKK